MSHDKTYGCETNIHENEEELLYMINDLKHICFGMYTRIIPQGFDMHTKKSSDHSVQIIASELAEESTGSKEGTDYLFYRAFYQTTIFFLLAMCNEEDQILLSLRKLANTFAQSSYLPLEATTFYYLLDTVKIDSLTDNDHMYGELCLQYYEDFRKYYENGIDTDKFIQKIYAGVNNYADMHNFSCITNESKYEEIKEILKNACNDAYFILNLRWEA